MFGKLLLLFIGIPTIEMLILIKLGELMGFWSTVFLVIVTGFLGAALARLEGLRTWDAIQESLRAGEMPAEKMLDALLILLAGIVLLTPGVLTDLAGFFLLLPFTRALFKRWLRKRLDHVIQEARRKQAAPDIRSLFL